MTQSPSRNGAPVAIYVWLVPSEEVLEQPGSWRIRKWDTEPFPEANYTARSETAHTNAAPQAADTATKPGPSGADARVPQPVGAAPGYGRDWDEDFVHENGKYQCRCVECGATFLGHKRRVQCRVCFLEPEPQSHDKNSGQKPIAWRYRYGKKGSWRFCDSHEDCNESPNYEIEPLYAAPSATSGDQNGELEAELRAIASKHARDAVCPIGSMQHPGDPAVMQEKVRAEEVIFYALKEAARFFAPSAIPPTEPALEQLFKLFCWQGGTVHQAISTVERLKKRAEDGEVWAAKLAAMTRWLDAEQPDVWRRGIWDAINNAQQAAQGNRADRTA